ncbi:MAG: aminomethyl-transferring glycine dehydrogenase subunit GcvPA [Thaumarchaeota archaeon]|nr:aminomethyl-transferring glycine dehydrogenase subunit GcvPA [Nitrososphaerota archaeon]
MVRHLKHSYAGDKKSSLRNSLKSPFFTAVAEMKAKQLLPNLDDETIAKMLSVIGLKSIDDLFLDIPRDLKLTRELNIPSGMSEMEIERHMQELLARNYVKPTLNFLGAGAYYHYVPAVVEQIIGRSEFYTAYTPYQPEISQGMLQSLFEYQSLICNLTQMDAANSSMYDWGTAAGEAARMAFRLNGRKRILVSANVGPERFEIMKTYIWPLDMQVEKIPYDKRTGRSDLNAIRNRMTDDVSAMYIENPNFFGVFEDDSEEIASVAHEKKALLITGIDPISLGITKPPGEYGADIAVGEGQAMGMHVNFGGPYAGIFAVRGGQEIIRQIPGRMIGMTTTKDGSRRGFSQVLQTREQHIRRENATSNICTNQSLCALTACVYLALLGEEGAKNLSRRIIATSHYASKVLSEVSGADVPYFEGSFFRELAIKIKGKKISKKLLQNGIIGGLDLSRSFSELKDVYLYSFSELHSPADIQKLAEALKKAIS